jgi:hypothetical protein
MLGLALMIVLAMGQGTQDTVVRELNAIEQRLATTWKNGDCDAWGSMIAAEWSVIHMDGTVITREQALKMCRQPEVQVEAFTIDDVGVRAFDNAAVVTGRTTVTTAGPKPETVRLRFTDVFVRREGTWKVVASQATRITP